MSTPTAAQRSAWAALQRLDPDAPGFAGNAHIAEHLRAIRNYLESWVLPHVAYAAGEPAQYHAQRQDLRDDAARVARRAASRERNELRRAS